MATAVTITVQVDADTPVSGVRYTVSNADESVVYASGLTDDEGSALVSLASSTTYVMRFVYPFAVFTDPDELITLADAEQTTLYTVTLRDTVFPSGQDLCTIYGQAIDSSGQAHPYTGVTVDNLFGQIPSSQWSLLGPRVSTITDVDGKFHVECLRGSTIRLTVDGTNLSIRCVVPDQAQVTFNSLLLESENEIQELVE